MNCFVLTAIRSGSTYLTRMLGEAGGFGFPAPHSDHPSLKPQQAIREFFAPNPYLDPWGTGQKTREEAVAHLRLKLSFMGQQPCLFKVLMEQYQYYMLGGQDRALVEAMVPGLEYVWLERRDLVARTVSAYMFFHTNTDHIYDQKSYDAYMRRAVRVDERGLLDVYRNHVKRCDWSEFLGDAPHLKVSYEDLIADPQTTLTRCMDHLKIPYAAGALEAVAASHPRFKTERPESPAWKERLRRLLRKETV